MAEGFECPRHCAKCTLDNNSKMLCATLNSGVMMFKVLGYVESLEARLEAIEQKHNLDFKNTEVVEISAEPNKLKK